MLANHTAAAEILDESAAMEADPDDPRYCICNEVAYGDMVACDNDTVREYVISIRLQDNRSPNDRQALIEIFLILVSVRMVSLFVRGYH